MFNKLEIERFRGIRHTSIDGLKRVNLFFGRNNCGKSSLLDSIFLLSGMSNPKLPVNVNLLRDYRKLEKSDITLDFYCLDTNSPIVLKADNEEKRELQVSLIESSNTKVDLLGDDNDVASTDANNRYGLSLKYMINGKAYNCSIVMSKKNETELEQKIKLNARYKEQLKCRYLTPKYNFYTSIEGLVSLLKNKDEEFILNALKLIEPQLKDFIVVHNEVLVDVGMDKRIPINMMGDGARKIMSILTTIYECKNGIVLIDEISNGFHYSVMKNLWLCVISAAEKNNVQIYATTHDIDSIKGLRDAALNDYPNEVACYKLVRTKDDELKAYHYSLESVDYSINQDIEIR